MVWLEFAVIFFAASWLMSAVAAIALLCFDREHATETSGLTSDPATWQKLSPCGTNMETQQDREAA